MWCWLLSLLLQLTVSKTWGCAEQILQRRTVCFRWLLSLKTCLGSRNFCEGGLSSQSLCWCDCRSAQLSFSDMSMPGKLHKRVFLPLYWGSFLNCFHCKAPGRYSSGRNGDMREISLWHFPISSIWILSACPPFPPASYTSSTEFHPQAQGEYNVCRGGRKWEQPLGYCSDSYLFSILMKISHF